MCENGACGCGNGNERCGQMQCGPSSMDYAFLLGHWAKKEILKEKVKKRMDAAYGKELDAIADLIVEFVKDRNATQVELDKKAQALEEKMETVFGEEEE